MRLPGTRYQEHGWEHVRKLLGHCSLQAFAALPAARLLDPASLPDYVDLVAEALHAQSTARDAAMEGNSYGESVLELALGLVMELHARPADWAALCAAVASEHDRMGAFWAQPGADAILRKKANDLYAVLRDKVDADNYQVACGRECSPNRMYAYRMLDTAYGAIAALFADWQSHRDQVGAILGRPIDALPIEVRQMKSIADCRAEWVLAWSESLERFGGAPGPLHTRSKRFASLKSSPEKIAAMLDEIGAYEELSSNRDSDWLHDVDAAAHWLEDLDRVLADANDPEPVPVSPSLRYTQAADLLAQEPLPVRLAVYLKLLGGEDASYPDEWLDPGTGALPTMQQLAAQAQLSLPTLRKRRDAAIARLQGLATKGEGCEQA